MDSVPSNLKPSKVFNRGDYYYYDDVAREMKACEKVAHSLPVHVALFEEFESTATVAFEQINKSINE